MWKKKIWQPLYEIVFRNSAELAEEDMQILSFSIQLHRNKIALIFALVEKGNQNSAYCTVLSLTASVWFMQRPPCYCQVKAK